MASITTFARLEPDRVRRRHRRCRGARCSDPLWLLARQWQVGEFAGHDGGTPIVARWRGVAAAPTRFVAGPILPDTRCRRPGSTPAAAPLESIIERVAAPLPVDAGRPPEVCASRSTPAGTSSRCWHGRVTSRDYARRFPRPLRGAASRATNSSPRSTRRPPPSPGCTPAAAWTADGCGPSSSTATCHGSTAPSSPATVAEVRQAAAAWLAWLATLFDDADPDAQCWQPARFEYTASMAGRTSADPFGETTLTAPRYDRDTIDWYEFDVNGEVNLGTTPAEAGPGGHPHRRAGTGDRTRPAGRPLLGVRGRPAQPRGAPARRDRPRPGAAGRDAQRVRQRLVRHRRRAPRRPPGSSSRRRSWSPTPSACARCCSPRRRRRTSGRWGLFRHAMPVDDDEAEGRADQQPALPRAAGGAAADRAGRRAGHAGPRRAGEPRLGDRADASSRRCRSA